MDSTGAPAALGAPDAAMVVIGGGGVHGPGGGGPLSGVYPQPQATHAQVLADRALFMRLLPQLYAQVGEAAPSGGKSAWVAPSKPFRVPVGESCWCCCAPDRRRSAPPALCLAAV
jgi:hypothetical protein